MKPLEEAVEVKLLELKKKGRNLKKCRDEHMKGKLKNQYHHTQPKRLTYTKQSMSTL